MPDLNPAPPNFNQQLAKLLATSIDNECSENYSSQIKALIEKEPDFFLSEENFETARTIFNKFVEHYSSANTPQSDNILREISSKLFVLRSLLTTDLDKILKNQSLESPKHRADIAQMNLAEIEEALNLLLPTEYQSIKKIVPDFHRQYFQKKRQWNAALFLYCVVASSVSILLVSGLIAACVPAMIWMGLAMGILIGIVASICGAVMLASGVAIVDILSDKKQKKLVEYKSTHPLLVDEKGNVLSFEALENVENCTVRISCHFEHYPAALKDKKEVNQAVHGFFKERYDARGALDTDPSKNNKM